MPMGIIWHGERLLSAIKFAQLMNDIYQNFGLVTVDSWWITLSVIPLLHQNLGHCFHLLDG